MPARADAVSAYTFFSFFYFLLLSPLLPALSLFSLDARSIDRGKPLSWRIRELYYVARLTLLLSLLP